jgi:hypothetical protein
LIKILIIISNVYAYYTVSDATSVDEDTDKEEQDDDDDEVATLMMK